MNNKGFSLVELAISVMVIGILIGGVVKGRDVLDSAKMSSLATQVDSYRKALIIFGDIYGAFPGDMSTATTDIPGCVSNATCANGNGNGLINFDSSTDYDSVAWATRNIHLTNAESWQFWKHLAAADLTYDVLVSAASGSWEWGVTHPKSAFGRGGFELFYDTATGVGYPAHFMRFSMNITATTLAGLYVWTPAQAAMYDRKFDDGQPWGGEFVVDYGDNDTDCHGGGEYKISNASTVCVPFFVFKKI